MKIWIVFFVCVYSFVGFGQNKTPYFLTLSNKVGVMSAHRTFMEHLIRDKTYGFELSLSKQQTENSSLAINHKYPLNGLALEYRNFGYDDVLGKAVGLIQFQNFILFQTKNNLCLDFKFGYGMAYITKKYDKQTNPTNNAIGSHINSKAVFKLELNKFTTKYHVGLGVELSHYSNGATQHPNLGLNSFALYANIGYNYAERKVFNSLETKRDKTKQSSKAYCIGEGIISMSETIPFPGDSKKYPVFAGRFSFAKPLNSSWNFELGLDGVYNVSNQHKYPDENHEAKDVPQIGLYSGLAFNYYNSQIVLGLGYYLRDVIDPLGRVYNRVGYRYFFKNNVFGLFNIRANFGKADFFELGVGYKFNRK